MNVEKVMEKGYTCLLCRPKDATPPHLDLNPLQSIEGEPPINILRPRIESENVKVSFSVGAIFDQSQASKLRRSSRRMVSRWQVLEWLTSNNKCRRRWEWQRKKLLHRGSKQFARLCDVMVILVACRRAQSKSTLAAIKKPPGDEKSIGISTMISGHVTTAPSNAITTSDCPTLTCLIKSSSSHLTFDPTLSLNCADKDAIGNHVTSVFSRSLSQDQTGEDFVDLHPRIRSQRLYCCF